MVARKGLDLESAKALENARLLQQRSSALRAEVEAFRRRISKRVSEIKRLDMIHSGIDAQIGRKKPLARRRMP